MPDNKNQLLKTYTNTSDLQKLEEELDLLKKKREARRQQNLKRSSIIENSVSLPIKEAKTEKEEGGNDDQFDIKQDISLKNHISKENKSIENNDLKKDELNDKISKKDIQSENPIKLYINTNVQSHQQQYDEVDQEHSLLISKLKSTKKNQSNRKSNKHNSINNIDKLKDLYDSPQDNVNAALLNEAFENLNSVQSTPMKKNIKKPELKKSCSSSFQNTSFCNQKPKEKKKVPSLKKLRPLHVKNTINHIDNNQKSRPKWRESSLSKLKSAKGKVSTAISALENTTPTSIQIIKELKLPQPLAKYELPTSPRQHQYLDTSLPLFSPSTLLSSSQSFNIISSTPTIVMDHIDVNKKNDSSTQINSSSTIKKNLPPKKPKRPSHKERNSQAKQNNDFSSLSSNSSVASFYEPQLSPLAGECSHNLSSIYLKSKNDKHVEVPTNELNINKSLPERIEDSFTNDAIDQSLTIEPILNDINDQSSTLLSLSSSLSSSSSSSTVMESIMNDINEQLSPKEPEKRIHIKSIYDQQHIMQQDKNRSIKNNSQRKLRVINVDIDHDLPNDEIKNDIKENDLISDTNSKKSLNIKNSDVTFENNHQLKTTLSSKNNALEKNNNISTGSYSLNDNNLNDRTFFKKDKANHQHNQFNNQQRLKRYSDESYFDYRYDYHINNNIMDNNTSMDDLSNEKKKYMIHRKKVSFSTDITVIPDSFKESNLQYTRQFWNAFSSEMGRHQQIPTTKLLDQIDIIKAKNEEKYIPSFISNNNNNNSNNNHSKNTMDSINNMVSSITPSSSSSTTTNKFFNFNKFLKSKNNDTTTTTLNASVSISNSWWNSGNQKNNSPLPSSPPLNHPTKYRPKKPSSIKKSINYKMTEPIKPPAAIAQPDWKQRIPTSKYQRVTYA